jgi:hypothetical protein
MSDDLPLVLLDSFPDLLQEGDAVAGSVPRPGTKKISYVNWNFFKKILKLKIWLSTEHKDCANRVRRRLHHNVSC